MSLYFRATLTRVWAPVGQTPIVAVHPQRDHVHFYGALDVRNQREIALAAPEATSEMTTNFLMLLLMLGTPKTTTTQEALLSRQLLLQQG